jgi:hypothetical protein
MTSLVEAKALLISEYFTEENGILRTKWQKGKYNSVSQLNKRRFRNREAVKWAFSQGFLSNDPNERQWSMDWENEIYANRWLAPDAEMLDAEILWEILKDAINAHCGRSIIKHPVWAKIGVNPHGDRYHTEADYQKQWRILAKLAQCNYIWFQSCADLWNIELKTN